MGLADNVARKAGEKVVVPPKPTTAATTSSSRAEAVASGASGGNRSSADASGYVSGSVLKMGKEATADPGKFLSAAVAKGDLKAGFAPVASLPGIAAAASGVAKAVQSVVAKAVAPTVAGRSLSVAQSGAAALSKPTFNAAAGVANMADDVKNAAKFVATNTVARNTAAFTGTLAAGAAVAEPVKNFFNGVAGSSAAPVARPTTTGGSTAGVPSAKDGKVWTPADSVARPTTTGGSTAVPSSIRGTSLPADTVSKPAVTGTPANVATGSSTAAGARVGTGEAAVPGTATGVGEAAGVGAGAAAGAGVGSATGVGAGTSTGVGTQTGATTNTAARTATNTMARTNTRTNTNRLRFPSLPRIPMPSLDGSPVQPGAVQSDWQEFRGNTTSVIQKGATATAPGLATFSVKEGQDTGKREAPKEKAPTEGAKETRVKSPASWVYKNPTD